MPDITMCVSAECAHRKQCYRHHESGTVPDEDQSYADFSQPPCNVCDSFIRRPQDADRDERRPAPGHQCPICKAIGSILDKKVKKVPPCRACGGIGRVTYPGERRVMIPLHLGPQGDVTTILRRVSDVFEGDTP